MRWLVVTLVLLSGCLTQGRTIDGDEVPEILDTSDPAFAPIKSTKGAGVITVAAGPFAFSSTGTPFYVQEQATLLHVEIKWDDATQDINLALRSPNANDIGTTTYDHTAEGGTPGNPDAPHSITLRDPAEGEWLMSAFANIASIEVPYNVVATVFYGATEVPQDYTGF